MSRGNGNSSNLGVSLWGNVYSYELQSRSLVHPTFQKVTTENLVIKNERENNLVAWESIYRDMDFKKLYSMMVKKNQGTVSEDQSGQVKPSDTGEGHETLNWEKKIHINNEEAPLVQLLEIINSKMEGKSMAFLIKFKTLENDKLRKRWVRNITNIDSIELRYLIKEYQAMLMKLTKNDFYIKSIKNQLYELKLYLKDNQIEEFDKLNENNDDLEKKMPKVQKNYYLINGEFYQETHAQSDGSLLNKRSPNRLKFKVYDFEDTKPLIPENKLEIPRKNNFTNYAKKDQWAGFGIQPTGTTTIFSNCIPNHQNNANNINGGSNLNSHNLLGRKIQERYQGGHYMNKNNGVSTAKDSTTAINPSGYIGSNILQRNEKKVEKYNLEDMMKKADATLMQTLRSCTLMLKKDLIIEQRRLSQEILESSKIITDKDTKNDLEGSIINPDLSMKKDNEKKFSKRTWKAANEKQTMNTRNSSRRKGFKKEANKIEKEEEIPSSGDIHQWIPSISNIQTQPETEYSENLVSWNFFISKFENMAMDIIQHFNLETDLIFKP